MDKRKVIYYSDEMNDEFSTAEITPRTIDENYVYIYDSKFKRFTHFFWYRIVATPIAMAYVRLVFGHKIKGRGKFEKHRKDGYFMYGNHTQDIADPFIPNMINLPKTNYVVVHANNVSMPVLGKITPSLGALPIPEGMKGYKNFLEAIDTRISQGHCVVIYPEAHIWPYYTKIRNFPDTSFAYPAKSGTPVYCFTNTYHKRRFFKHPRIITYVDGPFYPDMDQPLKARRKELRDKVYQAMCRRAKNSDHEQIKYIRKTDGGTETND
ncbi:MAG: 1-acyl-sn-glycerol-3-phosphate acyltransferase [Eubacterium sp.]|nr:1-acyl-sn-glycerol-3-phosphate acyltransferase [Eubacterium sp.]